MMKGAAHRGVLTKNDIGSPTNFRHVAHNGQLLIDEPTSADPFLHLLLPCRSQPADGSTTSHESTSTNHVSDQQPAKRKAPPPPTHHTSSNHSNTQPVPHSFSEGDLLNLAPQRKAPLPPLTNQNASNPPITRVPHSTSEGDLMTLNTTPSLSPQRKAPPPPSTNQTSPHQQVILPHISSGHLLESNHKKPPPRPPPPRFNTTRTNTTDHVTSMLALTAMTTLKLINTFQEQVFDGSDATTEQQEDTLSDAQPSKPNNSDVRTIERVERVAGDVRVEDRNEAEEAIDELDAMLLRFSTVDNDDDALPSDGASDVDVTGGLDQDPALPASQQVVQDTAPSATGGLDDDPTPIKTTTTTVDLNETGELTTQVLPGSDALNNYVTDVTGQELPDIKLEEVSTSDEDQSSETLSHTPRGFESELNKCDTCGHVDSKTEREHEDVVEREDCDGEKVMTERTEDSDETHLEVEPKHGTASLAQDGPDVDSGVDSSSTPSTTTSDVTTPVRTSAAPRPSVLNWDPQLSLRLEEIEDQELRLLLEKAGVGNDELEDPGTRDFIYEFIQLHGGKKAVRQEALLLAGLPAGTLKRIRKKKKMKIYSVEEDEDNISTHM